MAAMTRIEALLAELKWKQPRLAKRLGCTQAAISHLKLGRNNERLPLSNMLDAIAIEYGLPHLTAAGFAARVADDKSPPVV